MTDNGFDYHAPETIKQVIALLKADPENRFVMAGGTDLLIKMRQGGIQPKIVVGLKQIQGLNRITVDAQKGLAIGATTLLADVAEHPLIQQHYPAVADAAANTANVQIRNMGTVVGNLCNASPSADNAPTLLAMDAALHLSGPSGQRRLALERFFQGPGMTALAPAEIVTAVSVPAPPPDSGSAYLSLSARGSIDCAAVCAAAFVFHRQQRIENVRLFIGACGPTPIRAPAAEKLLIGRKLSDALLAEAGGKAAEASIPITDIRASESYRRRIVAVLIRRVLLKAMQRASAKE